MEVPVVSVQSLGDQATAPSGGKHTKTVVQTGAEVETSLFCVPPGGTIPRHRHSAVWDLFFGVSGAGSVEYWQPEGTRHSLVHGSYCAVPPGTDHEVHNRSETDNLVFVLVHAPFEGYDHIRV